MTTESVMPRANFLTHTAALCLAALFAVVAAPNTMAESSITNIINATTNYSLWWTIGNSSSLNALIITNAGVVNLTGAGDGIIGNARGANSNMVLVTGAGSVWSNRSSATWGNFYVGASGSFNRLTIANSGQVFNGFGLIGYRGGATGNTVTVTGLGSVWNNSKYLDIGTEGSANSLIITNGGTVFNTVGRIGVSGASNMVIVAGSGSVWNNSEYLDIGTGGGANSLIITNGGTVFNTYGRIGAGGASNMVFVTGSGSVWSNSDHLSVGDFGSGNSLTITNGGRVFSSVGFVGETSTASNNTVQVSGLGSIWSVSGYLLVGYSGSSNRLTIGNNGLVAATNVIIGYWNSTGNVTTVTGGSLFATNSSGGATLEIRYGTLAFTSGVIAADSLRMTNNVKTTNALFNFAAGTLITRADSKIVTIGQNFVIGSGMATSQTGIWNIAGGVVQMQLGGSNTIIGNTTAGSGVGIVNVSGTGSVWSNSGGLYVGLSGSGNSLTIANGGTVMASNVFVGANSSSTNNGIDLSGGYLYATNAANGGTLDVRRGMFALNSGTVVVNRLYLTNNASSVMSFSAGLLRSGGSSVSNGVTFAVGDGTQSATFDLMGGTHSFADGLSISTNGSLISSGDLIVPVLLNAGQFAMTGGTLSVSGAFTNAAGGTFNLSGGSALVPLEMNNMGTFIQSGGFFDPEVFTNSGSFALSGGTNIAEVFLNLLSGIVTQSGGEQDVNYATNFGSWTISGGVANITNLFIESGGVFTNSGGALVSTNAQGQGVIDVRDGVFTLDGGSVDVDLLIVTNNSYSTYSKSYFNFNAGALTTRNGSQIVSLANSNLIIGNTTSQTATWNILGGTNTMRVSGNTILGGVGNDARGIVNVSGAGTV